MTPIFFKVFDHASNLSIYDDLMVCEWAEGVHPRWVEDSDQEAPEDATHYVQHPYDDTFIPAHVMVLATLMRHPLVERVWYGSPPVVFYGNDVLDLLDDYLYADFADPDGGVEWAVAPVRLEPPTLPRELEPHVAVVRWAPMGAELLPSSSVNSPVFVSKGRRIGVRPDGRWVVT